jgi:Raf kinase inhibitor-like YbhB/YbcL family protein
MPKGARAKEVTEVQLLLAMVLTSATFAPAATVPMTMVAIPCGGSNLSPQLAWHDVPPATRSFALIVHDPDAPHEGGFYHWVAYNLAPDQRDIAAGSQAPELQTGLNGTGSTGYFGPCPPPGRVHHYHFMLYALDTRIESAQPLDATALQARLRSHILAQAEVVGLFER